MQNVTNAEAVYEVYSNCKAVCCESANCCMNVFDLRHVLQVSVVVKKATKHVVVVNFDFNEYTTAQFVNDVMNELQKEVDDVSIADVVVTNIDANTEAKHGVICEFSLDNAQQVSRKLNALFSCIYVDSFE